mgnify:CR=1 FL=1|tara:strand:- start:214 stop:1671 length:1458 start_codon:yes stop_codon:yes gene_type:complete
MNKIKIFQSEINDGIAEEVAAQASVAYCSPATIHEGAASTLMERTSNEEVLSKVLAENKDQKDLHYIESVLVSTGWNKNDDVFTSQATWDARSTPEDKQFNFMHDENDIIGHITGCYVLSKDGLVVADEDQAKPDEFDIITQAVLYNSWMDPENKERMEQIVAEISEGKWFVSMECLFSGFDYALIGPDDTPKILARDESSAFLTKHLRSYGGTGEYEGYKVGRALTNISFSGKGLVSQPANPRSVILQSKSVAAFNVTDTNSNLNMGDIDMTDINLLEKQVDDLRSELAEAKTENEAIKAKIESAKDKEFADTVAAFEAAAEDSKSTISELEEVIKSTKARVAELEDELTQSQTQLAEAVQTVADWKAKEKKQARKAALIEAGVEDDESAEAFYALEDEAFDSIIAVMKKKVEAQTEDEATEETPEASEATEEAEEEATEDVTAEAFEEVESTEATLIESEEVDEVQSTRASIADWLTNNVLSK